MSKIMPKAKISNTPYISYIEQEYDVPRASWHLLIGIMYRGKEYEILIPLEFNEENADLLEVKND